MSAIVLPTPTGYVVWCDTCPREIPYESEMIAELRAKAHNLQDDAWERTIEFCRQVAARLKTVPHVGHVHGRNCVSDVCGGETYVCPRLCLLVGFAGEPCPGHHIPSRAELVERSSARRHRK